MLQTVLSYLAIFLITGVLQAQEAQIPAQPVNPQVQEANILKARLKEQALRYVSREPQKAVQEKEVLEKEVFPHIQAFAKGEQINREDMKAYLNFKAPMQTAASKTKLCLLTVATPDCPLCVLLYRQSQAAAQAILTSRGFDVHSLAENTKIKTWLGTGNRVKKGNEAFDILVEKTQGQCSHLYYVELKPSTQGDDEDARNHTSMAVAGYMQLADVNFKKLHFNEEAIAKVNRYLNSKSTGLEFSGEELVVAQFAKMFPVVSDKATYLSDPQNQAIVETQQQDNYIKVVLQPSKDIEPTEASKNLFETYLKFKQIINAQAPEAMPGVVIEEKFIKPRVFWFLAKSETERNFDNEKLYRGLKKVSWPPLKVDIYKRNAANASAAQTSDDDTIKNINNYVELNVRL